MWQLPKTKLKNILRILKWQLYNKVKFTMSGTQPKTTTYVKKKKKKKLENTTHNEKKS